MSTESFEVKTEPDRKIGEHVFAVNLQAFPSGDCMKALSDLQNQIEFALPPDCFRIPRDALHVSVFPVVWVRGDYGGDAEGKWAEIATVMQQEIGRLLFVYPPFVLSSDSVEARPAAVLLKIASCSVVDGLRRDLGDLLRRSGLETHIPNLTHVTLFRFRSEAGFDQIEARVSAIQPPAISWEIKRLVLTREEDYPSLRYTKLKAYALRKDATRGR